MPQKPTSLFDDEPQEKVTSLFDEDDQDKGVTDLGLIDSAKKSIHDFEIAHPTISKYAHRLFDTSYRPEEEEKKYVEEFKAKHGIEYQKPSTGMEGSLIPDIGHRDDEGWTEYLGKALFNNAIVPLGSATGLLGTATPGKAKVAGEVKAPIRKVLRPRVEPKLLGPSTEESFISPSAQIVEPPSFIAGSQGVAENRPYDIDLAPVRPALGATNEGTILPREVEGKVSVSPDLVARRGLPGSEIAAVSEEDRLLRQIQQGTNELHGNVGDPNLPPQLPSAKRTPITGEQVTQQGDVIDLTPEQYTVENPNRNLGAGVKSIVSPGKKAIALSNAAKKVNFPGIKVVDEIPPAGQATSKDISTARAEFGSADKTLASRPESAPIAKAIVAAEDNKLKFIATTERDFASEVKGLSKGDRILLGKALDGQSVTLTQELADKVVRLRSKLDEVFKQVPELEHSGRYITDYLTHIAKEKDDLGAGLKQIWEYHLKRPIFGEKLEGVRGTVGDIYEKGLGSPDSPFVKTRTGQLGDLEYDVNKVFPAYIESIAKVIYDKPAVAIAKETLKSIPDSRLKELAQWYIKNYTRYDSAPGLNEAWSSWGSKLRRTADRSMLGFSTGLQSLHAARIAANLYPELPGKYLAAGMKELALNPVKAYQETATLGFLQNEMRPWQFKTATQKLDTILQFGSAADFLDKSIGYHGFKKMFMEQGLSAEDASVKAIEASKRASLTTSPARGIKGFSKDAAFAGGELGRFVMQYKQVPVRIIEQFAEIAANAKENPAAARRMLTGLGLVLGATAGGVRAFHVSPKQLLPTDLSASPVGSSIYRVWNKLLKGDLEGALEDTALFITPAGKSLQYQLKHGPSAIE